MITDDGVVDAGTSVHFIAETRLYEPILPIGVLLSNWFLVGLLPLLISSIQSTQRTCYS